MSHRVTIKELQERLDEMKAQRDEARSALVKSERDLDAKKAKLAELQPCVDQVQICHGLIDAYLERSTSPTYSTYIGSNWGHTVQVLLAKRLAALLVNAAVTEGRLLQADEIRRGSSGIIEFGGKDRLPPLCRTDGV